ncbi:MAG: exonuclease sbcCD subunit D [Alteromonadaceae bacterium]|nr:MAG: exonuclease sbcCD subunit D [Alteromonadaceae bacterium]
MNILHTSDWHLGRALYGRKRYQEFEAFLDWLSQELLTQKTDVLLIAGDIFDNNTPSNRAQSLYYQFLCKVAASACRHVVIIAGNHDSPTFLDAPKTLLQALNVHVVGAMTEQAKDEVLQLKTSEGKTELIVCAVPYLRDRDIRTVEAGESMEDKERKLRQGIEQHYAEVVEHAVELRQQLGDPSIPMIGMGHLFTAGGKTVDGDGVRDLYIGSLAHVTASIFPEILDYVALGHLHVPQRVNRSEHIRYCGSPIAMGFGEAKQNKIVHIIKFTPGKLAGDPRPMQVSQEGVPKFQALARIQGDWQHINDSIQAMLVRNDGNDSIWLEITYDGQSYLSDLRERIDNLVEGSAIEVLRIRNLRLAENLIEQAHAGETLDELSPDEVFERRLNASDIPEEQQQALKESYQYVLNALAQDDANAE